VRFGVATKTEFRLTAPDCYYNLTSGGGPGSGVGELAVGVKQQLGPTPHGFDISATLFVSFPTGAATVSNGGYDPGLQVAPKGAEGRFSPRSPHEAPNAETATFQIDVASCLQIPNTALRIFSGILPYSGSVVVDWSL
jgi:hypothetical protein